MNRLERWLVHLSQLTVGGTGLIYAVMLYAMESEDPFSIVNHPLQPRMQHLHVLLAPLFIFAVGMIWRRHVWAHWSQNVRKARRSGVSLFLMLVPMIASGYLLQTTVDPQWRQIWGYVHLVTSGIWVVASVAHFVAVRGKRASARQETP